MNSSVLPDPLMLEDVAIRYDGETIISDVSFTLSPGEIGCLLGASGSGKSSLLRAIAGFVDLQSGVITCSGELMSGARCHVPPHERKIGMVFQDHALFPHLDVKANIGFGLGHLAASERASRINELIELIKLEERQHAMPHELSGGEAQRVALARALAPQPRLLLLDEPFSSLDEPLRHVLAQEVRDVLKASGIPAMLVTHDVSEALAMTDRLGILANGTLCQWGDALDTYHYPASVVAAKALGESLFIDGTMQGDAEVKTELGLLPCRLMASALPEDGQVNVLLRSSQLIIDENSPVTVTVESTGFKQGRYLARCQLPSGHRIDIQAGSVKPPRPGEQYSVRYLTDIPCPVFGLSAE